MTLSPDGFEIVDDLPEPVQIVGPSDAASPPPLADVLTLVTREMKQAGLALFLRSDRLRVR